MPVTGERKSVKIFASVEVYAGQFIYRPDEIFKAETYLDFLEQRLVRGYCRRGQRVIYIHDHAPYHREQRVLEWFGADASWLELHGLPAYSPQFNAAEPLWHHTRVQATHNRSFKNTARYSIGWKEPFAVSKSNLSKSKATYAHFSNLMSLY